jgi:hypothetical protein
VGPRLESVRNWTWLKPVPVGMLLRREILCALLLTCLVGTPGAQNSELEARRRAIEQAQCSLLEAHHAISSIPALASLAEELKRANPYLHDRLIAEVLCHDFTGHGQKDMVVFVQDGAQVTSEWLAFRRHYSGWTLIFRRKTQAVDLGLAGGSIEEWEPIFRANDPDCCPSGGQTYRLFHWNGKQFVRSATKKIAPSAPHGAGAAWTAP